jgi:ATP-binding cassette subfamily F protein 3
VLLEALAAFSGTVIFVSHDRYFIDRLATRVLEVEGGTVTSHEGNYEDYLRRKEALAAEAATPESAQQTGAPSFRRTLAKGWEAGNLDPSTPSAVSGATASTTADAEAHATAKDRPRRLNPIRQKQMEERCAFLEEETPRIEAAIAHTEELLGIYVSAVETQRLSDLAEDLRGQLASLTAEWEELMMQLEGA